MKLKEMYDNSKIINDEIESDTNYLDYSLFKTQDILKNGRQSEYLGKNIKYGENVYYVTNKGALKLYPSPDIFTSTQGKNNCPVETTIITEDPMGETFREKNPYVFTGTNMRKYGSGIETTGQSCGNAGSTVFVEELAPVITEYRGCVSSYVDAMENIGENDDVYTFDQCKELANKGGYSSFSLTPSQPWDISMMNEENSAIDVYKSIGQCYATKTAITATDKIAYAPPELYTSNTVNVSMEQCTRTYLPALNALQNNALGNNPNDVSDVGGTGYVLVSRQYGVIQIIWNSVAYAEWTLSRPNCVNGGGVNVIGATYGSNCATKTDCSVVNGNFTDYAINNVQAFGGEYNPYPSSAQMNVGEITTATTSGDTETFSYSPAPSPVSSDCACTDFSLNINYKCGNIPQHIYVPATTTTSGVTASTAGETITLDCTDNYNSCNFGIGISDLGDVKIIQGIDGTITADLNSLNIPPYNGTLVSNTSILTATGVVPTTQVSYNNVTYNVFMAGNSSTLSNYGTTLGVGEMIVSPSGTCYISLGANMLLTITYFVKTNACSNQSGNWVGLIPSSETYIQGSSGAAPPIFAVNEILNENFSQNLGKKGYVDDDLILHEYPSSMLPTYTTVSDFGIIGTPITPPTFLTPTSVNQCEYICNGMQNCNYFTLQDSQSGTQPQCTYYSSGTTGSSSETDLYIKVQPAETNENCPFSDPTIISTSEWEYYAKGEQMNPTTSCSKIHDNYLNTEINNANYLRNKTKNELNNQTNQTMQYLKSWQKLSTNFEKRISQIKNLKDNIDMYEKEGFDNIATIDTMFQESQDIHKKNRYRNIFWSFLAITFLIMVSRIIYIYLK